MLATGVGINDLPVLQKHGTTAPTMSLLDFSLAVNSAYVVILGGFL